MSNNIYTHTSGWSSKYYYENCLRDPFDLDPIPSFGANYIEGGHKPCSAFGDVQKKA